MRKGKLQQSVLVRSVFKMLGQKREDAAGPAVGRGVSAFAGEKETQVFSCARSVCCVVVLAYNSSRIRSSICSYSSCGI